jgi:uncharacterized repeat protein (TIGR01451 family)
MRKSLLTAGIGLALAGVGIFSALAVAPGFVTLSGHVPAAVSQLTAKGNLAGTNTLTLGLGLPLRNREALTNLLQQIYDPASTNYHRYLTPEQFTAQFGPTEQDYQAVKDFAAANGLAVVGTHPNRMLLNVSGSVDNIQTAFHTTLHTYAHPTEARDFIAPVVEPTVSGALPIVHISGLDTFYSASSLLKIKPASQNSGAAPALGSAPFGSYQGSDFRKAYVPGTTLAGNGQNVALFQLDGFYPSDIAAYANQIGLVNPPQLVTVPVDGGVPTPTAFGNGEVSLDIEMVLSMSPGVSNIYVYEGPNLSGLSIYTVFEDILNKMATDNLAKQIGCSWFIFNGVPDPVAEQIFQQMALQGQSFYQASGDNDAYTGLIPFPCDSPHITLVGGTTLTTGFNVNYNSETVWNRGNLFGIDGIGSGGGVSTFYAIPSWQTNINMVARQGSAVLRNVPDVALTSENVWVIYGGGQTGVGAGTSCAAPLWAGFTALVNQQAVNNGRAPVGFINPAIYAIANTTNYNNCFHDTTTGDNTWSSSPNRFRAFNNYDLATGLGTPNGTNLINALVSSAVAGPVHLSPPPPPYGTTLSALNGGNPNGNWQLFVQDDAIFDAGIISNGWILTLTTANPVGSAADVALSMTASPTNLAVSNNVVYVLAVTNYGPSTASNVVVVETLPSGVTLIGTNLTSGSLVRSGFDLIWNVGTLITNAGAQLTLTGRVDTAGSLINLASASTTTPDLNPDDDNVTATITSSTPAAAVLSAGSMANGIFRLQVTGTPGVSYIVQATTNLASGNWLNIYTSAPPYNSPFIFTNLDSTNFPARFYRALIGP